MLPIASRYTPDNIPTTAFYCMQKNCKIIFWMIGFLSSIHADSLYTPITRAVENRVMAVNTSLSETDEPSHSHIAAYSMIRPAMANPKIILFISLLSTLVERYTEYSDTNRDLFR